MSIRLHGKRRGLDLDSRDVEWRGFVARAQIGAIFHHVGGMSGAAYAVG